MNKPTRIDYKYDFFPWQPGLDPITANGTVIDDITMEFSGAFEHVYYNTKTKGTEMICGQADPKLFQTFSSKLLRTLFQAIEPKLAEELIRADTKDVSRVTAQIFYNEEKEPSLSTVIAWDSFQAGFLLPTIVLLMKVMMGQQLKKMREEFFQPHSELLQKGQVKSVEAHEPQQTPKGLEQPDNGFALRI